MEFDPKSIADHIDCLARITGAPDTFVTQVKQLFTSKGIPLETCADPYIKALDEAFRREERIRAGSQRARQNISQLSRRFHRVGEAYVRRVSGAPETPTRRTTRHSVTIQGDHRSYVTRVQRENWPTVPGPDELQ
jgi:hypothetical protein